MAEELHNFPSIQFDSLIKTLDNGPDFLDGVDPVLVFNLWLEEFGRMSIKFYAAQNSRYRILVRRNFYSSHGILEEEPVEEWGLVHEWENAEIEAKLNQWQRQTEDLLLISEYYRMMGNQKLKEILGPIWQIEVVPALPAWSQIRKLNSMWFNSIFQSTPDEIQELRKLPYEQYLMTPYWKRVRAAMFLIHEAICQEVNHFEMGESWYFGDWESDLHVHHLTYDNLGNERYEDLVLLCKKHHEIWHENEKKKSGRQINIVKVYFFLGRI